MTYSPVDSGLAQELRRGTLVLAVLSALDNAEMCGSHLRVVLLEAGLAIDDGALYPMLRRLEAQGLLTSERRSEASRMKRFYSSSNDGRVAQRSLLAQWHALAQSVTHLNGEADGRT